MGASLTALLGYDVTDPRSPHSVHVTSEADVPDVAPWGHDHLHLAVRLADEHDAVVVLDHGRGRLYLAREEGLSYRPPGAPGLGRPPALVVADPAHLRPDGDHLVVESFDPALLDAPAPDWPGAADTPAPAEDSAPAGDAADHDSDADDAGPDPGDAGVPDATDAAGSERGDDEDAEAGDAPDGADPTDATEADGAEPESVTVSPSFDVLVPAFDIEDQGEPVEPVEPVARETPATTGAGTPSG